MTLLQIIDIGTADRRLGIFGKDNGPIPLGVGAGATASGLSTRVTVCVDYSGMEIEAGGSVSLLTAGAKAGAGLLPDGSIGFEHDAKAGWYGAGVIFRIKPA